MARMTYAGLVPAWRTEQGDLMTRDDAGPRVAGLDGLEGRGGRGGRRRPRQQEQEAVEGDYEGDHDYEGDDELAGEVGEIGDRLDRLERRLQRSNERQENKNERRDNRQEKMNTRMDKRQSKIRSKIQDERQDNRQDNRSKGNNNVNTALWSDTAEAGEATGITGAGLSRTITVRIENWDWFKVNDLSFEGSTDTKARVKSVQIAGTPVWTSDTGLPVALFNANSTLRGILKRTDAVRGGLAIKIELITGSGTVEVPVYVIASLIGKGYKKKLRTCR